MTASWLIRSPGDVGYHGAEGTPGGHNEAAALRDPARGHVRIGHCPHSQRDINALVDEIHVTVVKDQLNIEVGVFG